MVICKSLVQRVKEEWWDWELEAGISQRVPWATGLPDCRQASEEGATWTKVLEAHFLTPSFPSKWWEGSVRTEQPSEVGWEKEFIILAWEGLMSSLLHCMSGTFLRVSLRLFSSKKLSLPWLMDISYGVFIALVPITCEYTNYSNPCIWISGGNYHCIQLNLKFLA